MSSSVSSGVEPGYGMPTPMNGKLMFGNCSRGSSLAPMSPMTAIAAKTIRVVTGRRSAKSVWTMSGLRSAVGRRGLQRSGFGRVVLPAREFLAIEHGVQHRDHDEREEGGDQVAADHGDGHGAADLRAFADADRHGQQADDGAHAGDEDGAQARTARQEHGIELRHAALPRLVDGIDEHYGVVDYDTGQHDEPDQRHRVDGGAGHVESPDRADESHRDREQDDERVQQRFEL